MQIRLSEAIENLREELKLARNKGENRDLQFNVGAIEIELEVVMEKDAGASGKINWYLFAGTMDSKAKDTSKHKLKLSLNAIDNNGNSVRVSQLQRVRPE